MLGIVGLAAWARRPFSSAHPQQRPRQMSPSSYLPTACTSVSTRSSIPLRLSRKRRHLLYIDEVQIRRVVTRTESDLRFLPPPARASFTGSSVLDIGKGEADLSRRAPKYHLQGLPPSESFAMRHNISCEPYTLEEISPTRPQSQKSSTPSLSEYLASGYYPFGSDPNSRSNSAR